MTDKVRWRDALELRKELADARARIAELEAKGDALAQAIEAWFDVSGPEHAAKLTEDQDAALSAWRASRG